MRTSGVLVAAFPNLVTQSEHNWRATPTGRHATKPGNWKSHEKLKKITKFDFSMIKNSAVKSLI
jgi:hypothetical protein